MDEPLSHERTLSPKDTDWTSLLNNLGAIQKSQEQVDRSVRDEIPRNRGSGNGLGARESGRKQRL